MKIPQGADVQLKTENSAVELHVTAVMVTEAQADELIACIKKLKRALESDKDIKRSARKPKMSDVA